MSENVATIWKPGFGERVRIKAIKEGPFADLSARLSSVHGQVGVVGTMATSLARVELESGGSVIAMFEELEPA